MANKALKAARKAYSKNKDTKYKWENGKKTEKKKPNRKKEKSVASSYGQVEKKTQTVGSQGEKNRKNASVKKAASSVKNSLTPSKSGGVTPVSSHYGNVTNKAKDRTFTDKKWTVTDVASKVKETANVHSGANNKNDKKKPMTVSSHFGQVADKTQELGKKHSKKVGYDDSDVKDYIGENGTAKGTEAGKAFNRHKTTEDALKKEGEKKVTTTKNASLLYGIDAAIQKAGYMSKQPAEAAKFYDKEEKKAQKEGMTYGDKKEFIRKWVSDKSNKEVLDAIDEYKNQKIKDSSYTYTKAPTSTGDFFIRENASKYANNQTSTTTNQPVYQTDKDGNIKYDKNGKPKVKKDKNGNVVYQKIDSNQGNNILDYYGGGFDENGRLTNQNASTKVGNQTAGWIHDAPVAAGIMQGLSYSDITRGLGNYSNAAAKDLENTKNSGAFNVGYMIGQGGQFLLGGTNKMTDALVKGIAKSGATRSALNVGLRKGAADMMFEAPLNTLDALKMSRDSNGNIDKNAFVKYMALNSGLSGGIGGLIGGAGSKLAKNDAKSFIALSAKANSGASLTEQEVAKLANLQKKFDSIRQGNDVAKTDIVNKADYDAEVGKKVFEKGGTVDDAIKTVNGGSTHTEKIGYANSIKETANSQFEQLRAAREQMLEQAKTASPEEAKVLRREASKLGSEISRLGEIANTAEKQLTIELKRNKKAVTELTQNVKAMSEATGINYRVVNDKDMKKLISEAGGDVSDDYFYKGFYYKNKNGETEILINSDSPQAHQTVIGHETGHLIKSANEEEFNTLGTMLEEYAKKNDDFDAVYNQLKRSYPEATEAKLREEVTCELLGRYVYGADDKFIKQLAGEKPSVVQRIVDYLKRLFDGTTDKEMQAELKAIIDKTESLVKDIDSSKSRGYNNATEVMENGRGLGNESVGGVASAKGRSERVVAEDYADDTVGGKRGETTGVGDGEPTKGAKADITESSGDKLWETSKIVGRNKQVTKEANDAYLEAVRSGDNETAQKYIDSLAEIKFPDSVVRNKEGKLEKQTHGTIFTFDAFDSLSEMGNHFGTRTAAEELMAGYENPRFIEAYLNVTNPIIIKEDLGNWDAGVDLTKTLYQMGVLSDSEYATLKKANTNENLQKLLKEKEYDGIQYINGHEDKGSTSYIVFDAKQIKSADPVTHYKNGDPIPLTERFNKGEHIDEYKFAKESKPPQGGSFDENNIGYHAGDLGKAESMGNQTGGRGTGHFGTGTYFVGNKVKIDGYNARNGKPAPVETVNFDKYNLYKPYNTEEAYALHDFLRDVNDYFELVDSPKTQWNFVSNIKRRTDDLDYKLWDAQDELESLNKSVKSMDDDSLLAADVAEQRVFELREELYELGKDALGESRVGKLIGGEDPKQLSEKSANEILWDLQHPEDGGWYNNWERPLNKVSSFYDGLDVWAIRLNTSKDKLLDAMREAKKQSDSLPLGSDKRYTADSASTLLMKKLGYEGVDVRHTDLDNTTYGSVIYDLKGEDLARKKEIGTARFSKEAKPKKSLYNYGNEKPEQKISKKVEALQKENDAQIKTMTTSNNADEVAEALAKSDEVEAKIEGLGSTPRRGEQPKTETPKEAKKTEAQKLSENKYASDEVKTALKDIEDAGVYKEDAEKVAKKYNDLDGKIAGLQNRINNAKNKDYPTEAEKTAHIAELEDELRALRNRQKNVAGEIEQMGKMKAVDNSKTAKEQIRELHGDRSVNEELKNADNLKNEDSWIKDKWNSVRRLWEDSLIDVENVAKKTGGELREQMLTAANRVRNSMNVANNWITHTRKSFDNKVGGKALDDIFTKELIQNEVKYNDFQEYLIMKHVPARHAKGTDIYADISPELAEKRVKELEKEYGDIVEVNGKKMTEIEAWANDVYDYLKDLQQYRVDSGLLSKEAADEFAKDYPFYVPTNRVNDETVDFFTGGTSNGIRTAKGGESEVLDMYSQLYTATNKTIHAAEENQMLNLYFKAKGVTDEQIKQYSLKDLEHATINATVNKKTGAAKVSFFIDGKPVEFPCSHQLALGLRELDGLEFERLMKAAKVATLYGKPFKALITDWNLVFGVRNGMRDLQQAVVNSKDTKYFGSSMGAAAHAIADNNSPYRKAYASMGGEQAQLVSYDAVAERMGLEKGRVDKIHEKVDEWVDASVNVKGKDVNTNPIHYIEGINGAIEMMPRMCEFIGTLRKNADAILKKQGSSVKKLRKEIVAEVEALEKSGKVGATDVGAEVENRLAEKILEIAGKDGLDSAMRNANDITLNFGRSGVLGKALNMGFVPYLNPSIQGLSKLARLFTEAGGEGGWKALASIGMKLGTFTIAPAVWNELALRNNEDFQNINTRDKDNNFFIALGDGKFLKIPKPRENAVLAEPVEYGLRYFLDKTEYDYFDMGKLKNGGSLWEKIPLTDEGKQSFRTALDNIGVINPATSNMFSPLWQTFHNKTWYGGSIESAYEVANKKSQDRYDTGTSGVAIWLGDTAGAKFLNLSPKKIDNIMDSYLGMIYDLGISQTTEEAKTRGNYVVRTMASQFIKDSVFSNKLSTKAWDKIDGMSEEKAQSYKSKYMYDTYKYDDAMDMITADKNMTVQEKMAAKRELQKQKNKINRAAIDGAENESNPLVDIAKHLGAHKTLNNFLPKSGDDKYDTWTDYYKNYKKSKGFKGMNPKQKEKEAQKFLDVYTLGVKGQSKVGGDFHDSPSWSMTGVAAAQRYKQGKLSEKDAKTIMESCGVYESQTESYFKYADHGGNVSRYAVTKKNNNKAEALAEELGVPTSGEGTIWKNKYSKEKGIKGGVLSMSLATGKADFKDRAYYISNSGDSNMLIKMNAARGYSEKYGHTTKQLIKLGKKADTDGNTYLSNEEIVSACNTIKGGKATNEEKAMGWVLLGGNPNKNPFGAIGDYSHDGDTGITADDGGKSGGGRGRRGRRGRGGGGGGSSKGTMPKTDTGAIKGKVTDVFATSNGSKGSNLNDTYRKKVRKLRGQLNKK